MNPVSDIREYAGSTFPLTAPAPGTFLRDPVAAGLVDFIAWWLNKDLNPWLSQIAPHSAQAVPAANRFPYDPANFWVRNEKPALYIWFQSSADQDYTVLLAQRVETFGIFYVGEEVVGPGGATQYSGLAAIAARSISNACDAQLHTEYGYSGDAPGTPIWKSIGIRGWRIGRVEYGMLAPRPNMSSAPGGPSEGGIVRFFPALQGTLTVQMNVNQPVPRDPENVTGDIRARIRTNENGDLDNAVDFMQRNMPGPDGSEQP